MLTVIGTLGGVFITALFGLLTARVTHRWQYYRTEQEHRWQVEREIRKTRHETYARLIVAAQALFDKAMEHYQANRATPIDVTEFLQNKPREVDKADTDFEICRVEAYLLAGPTVVAALDEYSEWLRSFWVQAASGTDISALDDDGPTAPYHRLIRAMQGELAAKPDVDGRVREVGGWS